MNRAVVGVGANIEPRRHIAAAKSAISRDHRLVAESAFVTTRPIGDTGQPDFVNGAVLVETPLNRRAFKAYLRDVERRLGRKRTANRDGPRTIDLDIVVWNGDIVDHDVYERDFLREALVQVAPHVRRRLTEGNGGHRS